MNSADKPAEGAGPDMAEGIHWCPHCGEAIPIYVERCPYCRNDVPTQCPACAADRPEAEGACPHCGAAAPGAEAVAAARLPRRRAERPAPSLADPDPLPAGLLLVFIYQSIITAGLGIVVLLLLFFFSLPPWAFLLVAGLFIFNVALLMGILKRRGWAQGALILVYVLSLIMTGLEWTSMLPGDRGPMLIGIIHAVIAVAILIYLFTRAPTRWFQGGEAGGDEESEPEQPGEPAP